MSKRLKVTFIFASRFLLFCFIMISCTRSYASSKPYKLLSRRASYQYVHIRSPVSDDPYCDSSSDKDPKHSRSRRHARIL